MQGAEQHQAALGSHDRHSPRNRRSEAVRALVCVLSCIRPLHVSGAGTATSIAGILRDIAVRPSRSILWRMYYRSAGIFFGSRRSGLVVIDGPETNIDNALAPCWLRVHHCLVGR